MAHAAGLFQATKNLVIRVSEQRKFASVEENIPQSVFMILAKDLKDVVQWAQFSNFKKLVNAMAYVQIALSKYKPAILVVIDEESEKAKAIIFKVLQHVPFGEQMNSMKTEKKITKSSKILQFSPFLAEEGPKPNRQSQLDFNEKHPILLDWKHHAVEGFLRTERKEV